MPLKKFKYAYYFLLSLVFLVWMTGDPIEPSVAFANMEDRMIMKDMSAVDDYVSEKMRALDIPGLALAIVSGDQIIHMRGFGVADETGRPVIPQTPFQIGSITKSFTALAVMQLAEEDRIHLDDPVRQYLPWFRVADEADSERLTIRHLLNQASGLSTFEGNRLWGSADDMETAVRGLRSVRLAHPPGEAYQYSNINYSILGLVIESVSGQKYEDYIREYIFDPLGMNHSHTDVASAKTDGLSAGHRYSFGKMVEDDLLNPPAYLPAGFLMSSVEDMAHYAMAQLNGGEYADAAVLSQEGVAELHRPAVPMPASKASYGMGWVIDPSENLPIVWHNGNTGRFHSDIMLSPEKKIGMVLLANASSFQRLIEIDQMAEDVFELITGQKMASSLPNSALFHFIYWAGLLIPVAQMMFIIWGGWRWLRRQSWVFRKMAKSRKAIAFRLSVVALPNLAIAYLFLIALPAISGLPLLHAFRFLSPDLAGGMLTAGLLGIGWPLVYSVAVLLAFRVSSKKSLNR